MKKIFISSTLRTEWNRKFNPALCKALEDRGFDCFLPQRDVNPIDKETIADECKHAIDNASVLLSVVINESPNLGFEAGYAYGIGKKIILLTKQDHEMPDMFYGILDRAELLQVDDLDSIDLYIDELVEKIESSR